MLMLEQLGATTHYSCEGHPNSFYVEFKAPMALAERIVKCGYLIVELEGNNLWSLRINRSIDELERQEVLRGAAAAWDRFLGPLECLARPTKARTKHRSKR